MLPASTQPGLDNPAPSENARNIAHGRGATPQDGWVAGSVDRPRLAAAEDAFGWLVTRPAPLSLRGFDRPSLPRRGVPLHHLRTRLVAGGVRPRDPEASWVTLIFPARTSAGARARVRWRLGCVGVALPSLMPMVARLSVRYAGYPAGIEAAILFAFLAEPRTISTRTWTGDGLRSLFVVHVHDLDQNRDR